MINPKLLLAVSVIADILDFTGIGQIPGLSHLLDVPVIILHFLAGGPKALLLLLELVPFIGFIPIFSYFAWRYKTTGKYGAGG